MRFSVPNSPLQFVFTRKEEIKEIKRIKRSCLLLWAGRRLRDVPLALKIVTVRPLAVTGALLRTAPPPAPHRYARVRGRALHRASDVKYRIKHK